MFKTQTAENMEVQTYFC